MQQAPQPGLVGVKAHDACQTATGRATENTRAWPQLSLPPNGTGHQQASGLPRRTEKGQRGSPNTCQLPRAMASGSVPGSPGAPEFRWQQVDACRAEPQGSARLVGARCSLLLAPCRERHHPLKLLIPAAPKCHLSRRRAPPRQAIYVPARARAALRSRLWVQPSEGPCWGWGDLHGTQARPRTRRPCSTSLRTACPTPCSHQRWFGLSSKIIKQSSIPEHIERYHFST